MSSLYETDFYSWTQQQATLLRAGNIRELDIINLLEEVEDMGRSEKRELKSRLQVLLMHLLKWQYQSERRGKSWRTTIWGQRKAVHQCLAENSGLKPSRTTNLISAYELARFDAANETDIDVSVFPEICPWSFEQIMDENFWPDCV